MGAGYSLADVHAMTPDQIAMYAAAAGRRMGEKLLAEMNVTASATATAFTGNTKPIETIERSIRGSSSGPSGELQSRLKRLAGAVGAKIDGRSNGRRTPGHPGSSNQ